MKSKILSSAMLVVVCMCSVSVQAQLEVQTSGDVVASKNVRVVTNVAIGTNVDANTSLNIEHESRISDPYYGIKSHIRSWSSMPTGSIYAMCGFADASAITSHFPINQIVGVYGKAAKPSEILDSFSAGVAGMAHYYRGIGVYGGIGSTIDLPLPSTSMGAAYAGYFAGTVKVNGTLIATNVSTTSDIHQKENIQQIPMSLSDNIGLLQPVSYTLKQDSAWKYDTDAKELQGIHYGLIAQDVQKIFPELVYERAGKLSINYIELIPLLIMKVQELSAEVDKLRAEK